MWGGRSLVLLYALAALVTGAVQPAGQVLETVDVNIVNQNFDPAEIRVVDDVCDVVAFEGELLPNSSTTVSLCPDRDQRGHMTIYDDTGRAERYGDLLPSSVYLPMR
jgi:hypothetical protein